MGRGRLIMAWLSSCLANHNLPKNAPCACLKFLSTPGGSRGSRVRLASNPARREPGPSRPRSALRFPPLALRCSCPGVGPRARGPFPFIICFRTLILKILSLRPRENPRSLGRTLLARTWMMKGLLDPLAEPNHIFNSWPTSRGVSSLASNRYPRLGQRTKEHLAAYYFYKYVGDPFLEFPACLNSRVSGFSLCP